MTFCMDRSLKPCCLHPVPNHRRDGWTLLCCFCGCSQKLDTPKPAKTHGPYLRTP